MVKVGDRAKSKLKGAVDVDELLSPPVGENGAFLEIDPKDGFSVRNFHIQAAKMARVSDIVVYGDEESTQGEIHSVAKRIATAQRTWSEQSSPKERDGPMFNTFVVSSEYLILTWPVIHGFGLIHACTKALNPLPGPFHEFEKNHPNLVAIDSKEQITGEVVDFCELEGAFPLA